MIPLTTDDIHLWLTFYDEVSPRQLVAYRALLSEEEKKQELRFHFPRDRRRFLVTRALVRTMLSRYAHCTPQEWIFCVNKFGRPEIVHPTDYTYVSFNISHTHALIVLAITKRASLGVDVENVCVSDVSMEAAKQFLAPSEIAALAAISDKKRRDRFFEYWTLKESYIKARGKGVSLPLDKFSFNLGQNSFVDLVIEPELGDDGSRWRFWQFRPALEYLVAVCVERIGPASPALVVNKLTPLVHEEKLRIQFLRTSG